MRLALLLVLFAGCMPDAPRPDASSRCDAGAVAACICPSGATSSMACLANGTFAPCECEGTDAGADTGPTCRLLTESCTSNADCCQQLCVSNTGSPSDMHCVQP